MPLIKERIADDPQHLAWLFQHDNAPVHTARNVKTYLDRTEKSQKGQIKVLPWPSQSPDLNPLENLWAYLKQRVGKRTKKPSNLAELFQVVLEEWHHVPKRVLENLVESLPKRIEMVISRKGASIDYESRFTVTTLPSES